MRSLQINEPISDFLEIQGREITFIGRIYPFLCILSIGLLHIVCGLFPKFKIYLISKETNLKYANCVVLYNKYNKVDFRYLKFYKLPKSCNLKNYYVLLDYIKNYQIKVLDTEYGRFIFNYIQNRFVLSQYKFNNKTNIIENKITMSDSEEDFDLICKEILYGKNFYNLRLNSILDIIIENTFNLTVFITLFCTILYLKIDYVIYAVIFFILFFYGYFKQIYNEISIKRNLENSQNSKKIKVFRKQKFINLDTQDLVPGDLICIFPCKELPCDALLIKGDVISDESFLTGESVPICKSSLNNSIVYSGTSILTTTNISDNSQSLKRVSNLLSSNTNCALGVVIGTGFNTLRGKIIKDIINPKPVKIDFLYLAHKNIGILTILSFLLSCLLFYILKYKLFWCSKEAWIYILDLFFSLASPNLYASLNIGMQLSERNLKKENILCINLDRIYLGGNVEIAIFDKTGTLTSEGMEFFLVDDCKNQMKDLKDMNFILRMGLSSCHSVYELEGKYSGDTLDLEMFIFSKSKLCHKNNKRQILINNDNIKSDNRYNKDNVNIDNRYNKDNVNIDNKHYINSDNRYNNNHITKNSHRPFLKELDDDNELLFYKDINKSISIKKFIDITIVETTNFTSESRIMSVLIQKGNKKYYFCKGSPEKISSLLKNKPDSYDDNVRDHSLNGYRVIAMAYKEINAGYLQEEYKKDLEFLGLIVFSNKLKQESIPVIKDLNSAKINCKICTGDNILTAISVARECKIIDESITVIFLVVDEKCKNVYDVEWVCLGESDLYFDKAKLEIYKNNHKEFSDDFVVACEGKEYEFFYKTHYKDFILEKGRIFARFSPAQKKSLVEDFRNLNKNVLFCGDGANDSGAIGTADVGIALAQNEASLASSFSASNISAVPILIKECRNAYVTSLGRYKFVVVTNFIAYFNMFFLVIRNKFFTDFQSIHLDIILTLSISYFLTNFKRSDNLSIKKPDFSCSELSLPRILFSTLPMMIFNLFVIFMEKSYDVFKKTSKSGTYIFFINSFQIVFLGLMVSDCTPFREGLFKNKKFLFISIGLGIFNLILFLASFLCPSILPVFYIFENISTFDFILLIFLILCNGFIIFGIYAFSKFKEY